ncbi:MAG: bifunctional UDP-N-acetylglucosamine diphosphorylase/glucosamine-1-phosphate N-acetyltransferase GlmU [Candidatus Bipolaricaulaceae bacterium]
MASPLDVLVLAAGKGTRMRSRIPKVLHCLAGLPLLEHVIRSAETLSGPRIVVVVGHGGGEVRSAFAERGLTFVDQGEPLGTGHAVLAARPAITAPRFLVLPGDVPLVPSEALTALLDFHRREDLAVSFLSMQPPEPVHYGRVVRERGRAVRIVEADDASPEERAIKEVNAGVYCLENQPALWEALADLPAENAQGEYYLTDLVERLARQGRADALAWKGWQDLLGVNDRADLARLESILRGRIAARLMRAGVTIVDPNAVYLSPDAEVGADTVLHPGVHLAGRVKVGEGCELGPDAYLVDSQVEAGARVWYAVLEGAQVDQGARVGPYAHLRPGARIGAGARVGNFVEVKAAQLGEGVRARHLAYIGDAEVGPRANIGAGAITCNYDGVRKHPTKIGASAFIGSNAALVAPVSVGEGAYVGAGSVITEDVPPYALALARPRQRVKPRWAKEREAKA